VSYCVLLLLLDDMARRTSVEVVVDRTMRGLAEIRRRRQQQRASDMVVAGGVCDGGRTNE